MICIPVKGKAESKNVKNTAGKPNRKCCQIALLMPMCSVDAHTNAHLLSVI